MAVATRYTGKDLYVAFGGTGLTSDQRSFTVTREQETADITAGADGFRAFKATIKNFTASLEILADSSATGTAMLGAIQEGTEGTLEWGPLGTASGKPKNEVPVIVTSVSITLNFDDAVVYSIDFQGQGAFTTDELEGGTYA